MQALLNDPARLAAVQSSDLLDGPPDPALDEVARTAVTLAAARRVLITLVDARRAYFVTDQGEGAGPEREVAVEESLCRHVLEVDAEVAVDDARHDRRRAAGFVLAGIGAWVSIPLRSADGLVMGTLCVLTTEPRTWTEEDLQPLRTLARAAAAEMEVRRLGTQLVRTEETARRLSDVQRRTARELLRLSEVTSRSLFPHGRWSLGDIELATAVVARESPLVSANFADVSLLPGPRYALSTGGVAERGARAGELADFTRRTLRAYGMTTTSVAETVRGADHAVYDRVGHRGPEVGVASVWLVPAGEGALDVECVLAGHLPPLIRGRDGALRWVGVDRRHGPDDQPLGNEVAPVRAIARDQLLPGELLVVAGRGVREALSDSRIAGAASLLPLQQVVEKAIGGAGTTDDLAAVPRRLLEAAARAGAKTTVELTAVAIAPSIRPSNGI
jgi:sigma-B regulation protein RsbU (phosphoserine phosphatase)